jgi:hypothetical protein
VPQERMSGVDHFTLNIRIHKVTKTWVADNFTRSGGGATSQPVTEATRETEEVVTVTVRGATLAEVIEKAGRYLEVERGSAASAQ